MLHATLLADHPQLIHGFTTRSDGNLAFHVGDNPDDVDRRHTALAQQLGYSKEALTHMKQIHSDIICQVDAAHNYHTPPTCDALMTDRPGHPLMVMVADCTPILLFDPKRRVIAAVHAGRAGAFENIAGKTVAKMHDNYGCHSDDIITVLGPAIRACCYEVGEEIRAQADALGYGAAIQQRHERLYLDIHQILVHQLSAAGIRPQHIETLEHCTACESERFFSYRAEQGKTGRLAGIIMLKE